MLTATISWFAALTVWPEPEGPTWTMVLPTAFRTSWRGLEVGGVAADHDGQRRRRWRPVRRRRPGRRGAGCRLPWRRRPGAWRRRGGCWMRRSRACPSWRWRRRRPAPLTTPSTSGESGTMVMTTSASLTASAMLAAPLPPSETSLSILSWLRLKPVTVWPALTRLMAMGRPMMPSPMTATLLDDGSLSEVFVAVPWCAVRRDVAGDVAGERARGWPS